MFRSKTPITLATDGAGTRFSIINTFREYDTSNKVTTDVDASIVSPSSLRSAETASARRAEYATDSLNFVTNEVLLTNLLTPVLAEFLNTDTEYGTNWTLNNIYRDIYYHDHISGSIVDLLSVLPFSEFSLSGLKDKRTLQLFMDGVDSLNCTTLLPTIAVEYLVIGSYLGSYLWNPETRNIGGIMNHDIDFSTITPTPFHGVDPIIDIKAYPRLTKFLKIQGDPRAAKLMDLLPEEFKGSLQGKTVGNIPLNPETTIFIPRRGLAKDFAGVSYYKRVLAAWLAEKALIRGTIDQAYKRQRAALHIQAGNGTDWLPTQQQLEQITQLFMNIDLDPLGATIVTRDGINVSEVRRGDDFYKWSDAVDTYKNIKLNALGQSDSVLSSDANYSTMEQTMSVFIEQQKSMRTIVAQEVFKNRIFPKIAKEHGIYSSHMETASRLDGSEFVHMRNSELAYSNLGIPSMHWHKTLSPESDQAYLELLSGLEEKGIPIPIRLMYAAGGVDIRSVLNGTKDDLDIRKKLADYKGKIDEFKPQQDDLSSDGGADYEGASVRRLNPLDRKFDGQLMELSFVDNNGKRRVTTLKGRKQAMDKYHKTVASVMAELAKKENNIILSQEKRLRKRNYSYRKPDEKDT